MRRIKETMKNTPFVKMIGIIFTVVGIYFLLHSVNHYIECYNQKDWIVEDAVVTKVEQRIERGGFRVKTRKLVYDVYYQYDVGGTVYSGVDYSTVDYSVTVGDIIKIKYDPYSYDKNTAEMYPSVTNLIFGMISSGMFVFIALMLTGIIKFKRKKSKAG